jgi:hypothetical protein
MRFRRSALFPLVFSSLAFALVLVLVLSGTNPDLIPDGYLLSVSQLPVRLENANTSYAVQYDQCW